MRIQQNLQAVYELASLYFGSFKVEKVSTIDDLVKDYPQDSKYVSGEIDDRMRYMARFAVVDTLNPIEKNIQTIIDVVGRPSWFYGGKTYYENTLKVTALDLNNIEKSIKTMYDNLSTYTRNFVRLPSKLSSTWRDF